MENETVVKCKKCDAYFGYTKESSKCPFCHTEYGVASPTSSADESAANTGQAGFRPEDSVGKEKTKEIKVPVKIQRGSSKYGKTSKK